MGCTNSACMGSTQSEIEIRQKNGLTLTQDLGGRRADMKGTQPFPFTKEYCFDQSNVEKLNLMRNKPTTEDERMQLTEEIHDLYKHTEEDYNAQKGNLELNFDQIQFRYGKTIEELNFEFDSILQCLSKALQDIDVTSNNKNHNFEEGLFMLLDQWKNIVYDHICRKTGEIKNLVSFSSTGKSFKLIHEVDGWKEINLLRTFCNKMELEIDNSFFEESRRKLESIGSLTVQIWIEVHDLLANLNVVVGFDLTKPSDKKLLERFLGSSIEKKNLITWFDANTPVPIEYGLSVGDNGNELLIGFYFFDGPFNVNLGRSLTAFQAYGADINKQLIDVFKSIPSEEYKVAFVLNPEGVQRVRMLIAKLTDQTENNLLKELAGGKLNMKAWKALKNAFMSMAIKSMYTLEYSHEGFQLICVSEVGGEITSRVYIEDH